MRGPQPATCAKPNPDHSFETNCRLFDSKMLLLRARRCASLLAVIHLLVNCPVQVLTSSNGAPNNVQACENMLPAGHQVDPQGSESPYFFTLSTDVYEPNMDITVTISSGGGPQFKGFLIQARPADPTADLETFGFFTPDDESLGKHNCDNFHDTGASITHTSAILKDSVTFIWTAPDEYVGHLRFRATIVQEFSTFWMDIESVMLTDPTAPTLPMIDPTDDGDTAEPHPPMPTGTVPEIDLSECGLTKGCYREPDKCEQLDCQYLLTWQVQDDDTVDFEISVRLDGSDNWAAVGMSYDTSMGDDSVIDCLHDANSDDVIVQMSYNYDDDGTRANDPLDDKLLGLIESSLEGYYAGGYIMCRFTRLISLNTTEGASLFNDFDKVFDLDEDYHLFVGRGPVVGDIKVKHSQLPITSPDKVNLASVKYVDISGLISYPLIQAHGSLMVFAWMVFASFGVLMPRYFKPAWPEKTILGKPYWFQIHQPCMIFVVFLTITAFILIFIEAGGYAQYDDLPSAAHPPLGITVTILAILNPIGALFRPAPNAKNRPIFNWAHFLCGQLAHILAAATIFVACYMDKARLPDYTQWVVTAFICWHVLIEITLASHSHWLKKQGASIQVNLPEANGKSNGTSNGTSNGSTTVISSMDKILPVAKPPPGSKFKTVVVLCHLAGVLGLGITMVVAICTV